MQNSIPLLRETGRFAEQKPNWLGRQNRSELDLPGCRVRGSAGLPDSDTGPNWHSSSPRSFWRHPGQAERASQHLPLGPLNYPKRSPDFLVASPWGSLAKRPARDDATSQAVNFGLSLSLSGGQAVPVKTGRRRHLPWASTLPARKPGAGPLTVEASWFFSPKDNAIVCSCGVRQWLLPSVVR